MSWHPLEPRPGRRSPALRTTLLALASAFFVLGVLTREHYGTTWDEAESYLAGRRNLEIAASVLSRSGESVDWPWHELPGHQLVLDSSRAAVALLLERVLPASPAPIGERLFNLTLASASLVLAGALAFELTASVSLAALAAAALALHPKLIAHAQNNPKDLPGLFVFTLGALALVRLARAPTLGRLAAAAAALGLALTTWLPSVALAPVAAVLLASGPGRRSGAQGRTSSEGARTGWRRLGRAAALLGATLATAYLLWPWLWPDPIARLRQIGARLAAFPTGFEVLYFGELYPSSALPLHYTLGSLAIATPLAVLLLAVLGSAVAVRRAGDPGRRRLAALALGWIASLLALDAAASFHYDGVRHVLAVLPAVAILAALGAERAHAAAVRLLRRVASPRAAAASAALALAAPAAAIAVDLARLHPFEDAYLALPFRRLAPGAGERWFEIEYWGHSYRRLADWLNEETEPGAIILAPIAPHCLEPYLRPDLVVRERLRRGTAAEARPYLAFITRRAWYAELGLDQVVAGGEPLHAVRSPLGTHAVVYRPERIPDPLTRPGGPRSWRPPRPR
ncbi:MAG TPA: hypothetical protein VMS86_11400, partial [Thermoanaerobaculia bacterium]|nr:hypothetical protein [Thermoanaerobaculia bacterium]